VPEELPAAQPDRLVAPYVERLSVQRGGLLRAGDAVELDDQLLSVRADREDLDRLVLLTDVEPLAAA
jgi:hypothetical protein